MSDFLDNYEDVATRIGRFWASYPTGKIHTHIVDIDIKAGYILIECRVYKKFEDEEASGIDYAFGNVQTFNANMRKWFVEDTVTSAIGRAVGLVLGVDKRPTKQNMQQVENVTHTQAQAANLDVDPWTVSYKTLDELDLATQGVIKIGSAIDAISGGLGGKLANENPQCQHGHRIMMEGTSSKTGQAYHGYKCTEKAKANQCEMIWAKLSPEGKWVI